MLTLTSPEVLTLPAADGLRDTTTLTITSDTATDVALALVPGTRRYPPCHCRLEVIAADSLSVDVELSVDGLAAGDYVIEATPTGGETAIEYLTVGSGEPSNVVETLSPTTIYTWSGSSVRSTLATVSATDETGLEVPFTGSVVASVGGRTVTAPVVSSTGSPTVALVSASALAAGTGTVVATVWGPSETHYASDPATLKVSSTSVTSVSLSSSHSTVYPAKDGYADSVTLKVTPKTTTATSFASTGSVTVTRNGKTVKSWKLTSSKTWSATWDGRVSGKIVPGSYTVKVTLKGPQGSTQSASKTVKVSSGKLVTKTKSVTYKSGTVVTQYATRDAGTPKGKCWRGQLLKDDMYCQSAGIYGWIGLTAYGHVTVPSAVLSAAKYGGATVRASMHVYALQGSTAKWSTDLTNTQVGHVHTVAAGTNYATTLTLASTSKTVYFTAILYYNALLASDTITVKYTYKVMDY